MIELAQALLRIFGDQRERADELGTRVTALAAHTRKVADGKAQQLLKTALRDIGRSEDRYERCLEPFVQLISVRLSQRFIDCTRSPRIDPLIPAVIAGRDGKRARDSERSHVAVRHLPARLSDWADCSFTTFTASAGLEVAHRNLDPTLEDVGLSPIVGGTEFYVNG